jgi:hypothetical protein
MPPTPLAALERLCLAGEYTRALDPAGFAELGPREAFYLALVAFGQQDPRTALALAERASQLAPGDPVFAAGALYLGNVLERGKPSVYVEPEAFSAFIRSGSNTRLYAATSQALAAAFTRQGSPTLLDIGCGDGLALLPALSEHVAHVIALEPSRQMLEQAAAGLAKRQLRFEAVALTIQAYMAQTVSLDCDIALATFSLQNLPRDERLRVWPWLRAHARHLLLVEFDVPHRAAAYAAPWVEHVLQRYRLGLAEHAGDPRVVQGFLMPVLFGYFDPTAARTNYEQPRADWHAELAAGGFSSVRAERVDDYWWAPAYLFDAS